MRFGPFEANLEERVLRKHGVRVRLAAQPFQVLAALLEKSGTAVTREELRRRVWPEDTFVDFEHGLNVAVTRLRQALGDSADKPRYIETLPKRGYRFVANVDGNATSEVEREVHGALPASSKWNITPWIAGLLMAGVAVTFSALYSREEPPVGRPVPLTTSRGHEVHPALSPDGSHIAFAGKGEEEDNFDIFAMPIHSDTPSRLTSNPADDLAPAWSPDGRTIAFVRGLGRERGELLLISASGGPEHMVRKIRSTELRQSSGRLVSLAWSPDGRWIAASHRQPEDTSERIYLFSPTGEMRPLTASPGLSGDHTPAFSPDGRLLAFSRLPGGSTSDIYIVPLDSNFYPAGDARALTARNEWSVKPVWLPHGDRILYLTAKQPDSPHELRIVAKGGTSDRRVPLNDEPREMAAGRHLVYSRVTQDTNIWRANISAVDRIPSVPELFISSTRRDEKPRYSPDGEKIAFVSMRSGSPEIWVSKADGSSPVRISDLGGPLVGYPNWSPDGHSLVFHARPEGQADLFVMPAAGGSPKRLTTHAADDTMPSYSRDGRRIYFGSARTGRQEIWRMPSEGGDAVQLSNSGGMRPVEDPDGKSLYYLTLDGGEIQRISPAGGPVVKVVAGIHGYPAGFATAREGIYYQAPPLSGRQRFIRFFSFSTRESRPVAVASHTFFFGLSVSPDSKYVLFDQFDVSGTDLMLVKNFYAR